MRSAVYHLVWCLTVLLLLAMVVGATRAVVLAQSDTGEVRRLAQLAEDFRRRNRLDSAIALTEQLKTLAEQRNDKTGIGLYWLNVGYIKAIQCDNAASLSAFGSALKIFRQTADSANLAKALNGTGRTYFQQGRLDEALRVLIDALAVSEPLGNNALVATSLTNIGNLYFAQRQYDDAILHYQKAKPLFEELGDMQFVGFILNNVGNAYQEQGNYDDALRHHQESLAIKTTQGDERGVSNALNNIGLLNELKGNFVAALEQYRQSLALREQLHLKFETCQSLYNIARLCFRQDSLLRTSKELAAPRQDLLSLALDYALRSRDAATEIHAAEFISLSNYLLSDIYQQLGKPSDALIAYKQFIAARDSMFNQASVKKLNELRVQYETERKEKDIALLQKEAENQVLVRNSLVGGVVLFGLLLIVAANRYRLKLRSEAALREKNAALDHALRQVEEQKQLAEEAGRLKSEILNIVAHDLQTPLSSVINFAYLLNQTGRFTPKQSEMLSRITSISQAMLRQTVNLLNAAAERASAEMQREKINLTALLRDVISGCGAAKKQLDVHLNSEADYCVIGDGDKLREAFENILSNAVKYSPRQKTIHIEMKRHSEYGSQKRDGAPLPSPDCCILVSIRDEGQGLTDDDQKKLFGKFQRLSAKPTGGESSTGLGLYITKHIIELHSGRIWAESDGKGKGTTFFVELPLHD